MGVFASCGMGEWLKDAVEWWFPVGMMPHQAFLMLWLLSPFTDMLDTVRSDAFSGISLKS